MYFSYLQEVKSKIYTNLFSIFCNLCYFSETFSITEALCHVHTENRGQLKSLTGHSAYENPKMSELERVLLNQFGPDVESKGILFSKTRKSTHCLCDWVSTSSTLQGAGIKAAILTGAGNGIGNMTHVCVHKEARIRARVFASSPPAFLPGEAGGHHPQFPSGGHQPPHLHQCGRGRPRHPRMQPGGALRAAYQ